MREQRIICRGAEAVLYLGEFEGQKVLIKKRLRKGYRIPELDTKIRHIRTRRESELLSRARRAGILTPRVLDISKDTITMEWLRGKKIKEHLNKMSKTDRMRVYSLMGQTIARLHAAGIVHGDLTTSNMILVKNKLFLIDFGLSKFSSKIEDQAVDLYLLYQALRSTHFQFLNEAWTNILNAYKQKYSKSTQVLNRIEQIRKRRRYA